MSIEVVIVAASRTPIGTFNGSFSTVPAHDLGARVLGDLLEKVHLTGQDDVAEVIMGQALTAAQGQNPARQASMNAGISASVPAWGINMLCGSGLRAVVLASQSIKLGEANIIIAGGQESMSKSPHAVSMRGGSMAGNATLVDTCINDGLLDAFCQCHMGVTAENIATMWDISREEQDNYALQSQRKCENARSAGHFNAEIVPVTVQKKKQVVVIDKDEYPRAGCTIEGLTDLKPCFVKDGTGTVTPGNSSGVNDGAAAVVLMSMNEAVRRNLPPLARIVSWAQAGVEPKLMGTAPVPAITRALEKAGWSIQSVDMFELNEAFAVQTLSVINDLEIDSSKVNVSGGAIALGHPIGASGCRVLVTLVHGMRRTNAKRGVAALCVGGGMGIAMCVELV